MRNYKRAIELLLELSEILSNNDIFTQTEIDRSKNETLIQKIQADNPNLSYETIKSVAIELINQAQEEQFIVFNNKRYLLEIPSLKVLLYAFDCIDKSKIYLSNKELRDDDCNNFLNICIDMAKKCHNEVVYTNDKIRSMISELSRI